MDLDKIEKIGLSVADAIQGVTRPVVTIALTVVLCIGFLRGQVSGDAFLSVVGIIIAFWFKDREAAKDVATTKAADRLVQQMSDSSK